MPQAAADLPYRDTAAQSLLEKTMSQHTPVLVGISHLEQRFTDFDTAKEPVQLMIEAVEKAAADAGSKALMNADSVRVIKGIWPYSDPA